MFSFDMVFPYLSSTPPENWEIIQASGSLPGPWAVLPLRGSHRAVLRRKSHYAVMDLRRNPGAVRLLQASCRPGLSTVLALAADVAPHHRFVPDECVFSCQVAVSRNFSSHPLTATSKAKKRHQFLKNFKNIFRAHSTHLQKQKKPADFTQRANR